MNNNIVKENEIKKWLNQNCIENYTINDDLTVDVNGPVFLEKRELTTIPVKFNIIKGSFDCSGNKLTDLRGAPEIVERYFCCNSNLLTNFDYCPKEIWGSFWGTGNKIKNIDALLNCKLSFKTKMENGEITFDLILNYFNDKQKKILKPYYDKKTGSYKIKGRIFNKLLQLELQKIFLEKNIIYNESFNKKSNKMYL